MPELPEVETIARGLRSALVGRTVSGVEVRRPDVIRCGTVEDLRRLAGRPVRDVARRGKFLLIHLDGTTLLFHLGMTGRVTVTAAEKPVEPHTHLVLTLSDGRQVRHRDPRRFGFVGVSPGGRLPACVRDLGPEPLDLDAERLGAVLARRRRQMKALLMDQRAVAGIGNIYADEILFESRIHPLTRSDALAGRRIRALCGAMHAVLEAAIQDGGTTISDYVTGTGGPGGFQGHLRVYGRAGRPCVRCGRKIVRILVAQRGTHFCPRCQRPGRPPAEGDA